MTHLLNSGDEILHNGIGHFAAIQTIILILEYKYMETKSFFTPLRVADIIVASPLGLRQQCNIDPTTDNTFKARAGDGFKIVNFIGMLSSLHTLLIGDINALEMQNWEHF